MSRPHQPKAINLDGLHFEELGQFPIATQTSEIVHEAQTTAPAPHAPRCGKKGEREFLARNFEDFV